MVNKRLREFRASPQQLVKAVREENEQEKKTKKSSAPKVEVVDTKKTASAYL